MSIKKIETNISIDNIIKEIEEDYGLHEHEYEHALHKQPSLFKSEQQELSSNENDSSDLNAISYAQTKNIVNRMNRAIGHMEAIKKMVEDGRDCNEILTQIAAVRSAVNNIGKVILEEHINTCVDNAITSGDKKSLEDLNESIKRFVK